MEMINTIEKLAYNLTLPKDIATILEMEHKAFIEEFDLPDSPVSKAFNRGFLKKEFELKKQIEESPDAILNESIEKRIRNFKAKLTLQLHA